MIQTVGELRNAIANIGKDTPIRIIWTFVDGETKIQFVELTEFSGVAALDINVGIHKEEEPEPQECKGCCQEPNKCVCSEYWKDEEDQ